ncbi:dipeptide ABC transporter ATP-binding protein [Amycolatopsis nigrescens]|uniref:dipeptide ABC transporter ATP-binding protein n=1 Tax=Amycolatopsis nigrescens TaxID=381445 RepID=UPI000377656B|nr:dipeptide ABC transporter ATP-binding protein [Amycolatopsis nigrescens]
MTATPSGPSEPGRVVTRRGVVLRRLLGSWPAVLGLVVLAVLFFGAFLGAKLTPWTYDSQDYSAFLEPPSPRHWFGTTQIGGDIFVQTMAGLQRSLSIGLLVALLSTVLAAVVGASAGYFRGRTGRVLMWFVDLMLVLPVFLILAIMSRVFPGGNWFVVVLALAGFSWMIAARMVRGMTLTVAEQDFVRAAQFMGERPGKIIVRHVLPNISSVLIVHATINVSWAVLTEAGLSFFGFGVQPPDVSLGTLIRDGYPFALTSPWLFLPAGLTLIVSVLALTFVGDGLRDALDPNARRKEKGWQKTAAAAPPTPASVGTASESSEAAPLLEVSGLEVSFPGESGQVHVVRGLNYQVRPGEVLGIVGESGAGKSVSSLAVLGLQPDHAHVSGSVRFRGRELLGLSDTELSAIRGKRISMIFQDPLSALTPVFTVGDQVAEALLVHGKIGKRAAAERAVELLELVGIPDARRRARAFPHEFSGGMRQRVVIAIAIANDPDLIIADEPTTALDVTVQAQILDVLKTAQQVTGAGIVLITHDLGVVAGFADRLLVMYAGRAVEAGPVDEVYARPRMPYTLGLLGSVPRLDAPGHGPLVPIEGQPPSMAELPPGCPFSPRCPIAVKACRDAEPGMVEVGAGHRAACIRTDETAGSNGDAAAIYGTETTETTAQAAVLAPRERRDTVLEVRDLVKTFPVTRGVFRRKVGTVRAVDGISFDVAEGETLGLVGESGCGKTTTLLEILSLSAPAGGGVSVFGEDVAELSVAGRRAVRRDLQVVFQDPMASLDPRLPVAELVAEPMRVHGADRQAIAERVPELLELVGLRPEHASAYPAEFSGGQRQRIGIARALALRPKLIVLDEPVSALDVSIRAGVINLLAELRDRLGLCYLLVTHDLSVIRQLADRVAVMYLGQIVEIGEVARVFSAPAHPYTRALLSAVPIPDPPVERHRERIVLPGELPDPADPPSGCRFRSRCFVFTALDDRKRALCIEREPRSRQQGGDHRHSCHHA